MDLDFLIVLEEKTPSLTLITVMCLNFETPKIIDFPFATYGKSIILVVPIFKHIRVYQTDFNVGGNLGGEKTVSYS